jgi:hypothetical protein
MFGSEILDALRMPKGFLRATIPIAAGIFLVLEGEWIGWVFALLGVSLLVGAWRRRDDRPLDPLLKVDIDAAMKLEESDPAAMERLLDQAVTNAGEREDQELADLRRRASTDPGAAIELRSRLRSKLKTGQGGRERAEQRITDPVYRTEMLNYMDRMSSETELELAQVELYLEKSRDQ